MVNTIYSLYDSKSIRIGQDLIGCTDGGTLIYSTLQSSQYNFESKKSLILDSAGPTNGLGAKLKTHFPNDLLLTL